MLKGLLWTIAIVGTLTAPLVVASGASGNHGDDDDDCEFLTITPPDMSHFPPTLPNVWLRPECFEMPGGL